MYSPKQMNNAMFGGEPVFTYKRGAVVSSSVMEAETFGCVD